MSEIYDIIAQLGPNDHTDWTPCFPQDPDYPMVDGATYLVTEIMVSNVLTAQATYSFSYGKFTNTLSFDDLTEDNIRFNAIPLDANDTITLSVKWPFLTTDYQMLFKSGTAGAMTVLVTGIGNAR